MYLLEVNTDTNSEVILNWTSMDSQMCLPYISNYGLKPVEELWAQLYAWTSVLMLLFQLDCHSMDQIPSILVRVELISNIKH